MASNSNIANSFTNKAQTKKKLHPAYKAKEKVGPVINTTTPPITTTELRPNQLSESSTLKTSVKDLKKANNDHAFVKKTVDIDIKDNLLHKIWLQIDPQQPLNNREARLSYNESH